MKTLYILRHAESSWAERDISDFERPLNERGLAAAPFMGELMADRGIVPGVILSSPARRAKETAALLRKSGRFEVPIYFDDRIYEASPQNLLQVIAKINDRFGSAMLVGHNPGVEGLIRFLTGQLEPMPTGALAIVDLDIDDWDQVNIARGRVREVIRPSEEMV
ncbi:MAG TPA: histidine phosphatase family protein [Pyrinomonadaceae bacterium]|jgi:phosphohistidine phosphatase|nr:histidine phosphatase family protein [Pyrinomonadaceae bacterium]